MTPRSKTHIQMSLNLKRWRARSYSASPMEASSFMVMVRAPLCVLFATAIKVPSWTLRELLQHVNGKSRRGKGISGPEHSALAKYILSNDAMAHDRELGGVGD